MMDEMHKNYQILGLKTEASEKEILEAYKVLVKVWNPDRFSDDPKTQEIATEKIKEIDEAFKQLLIGVASHHEGGGETTEPQLKIRTEPLGTRGSIVVKTDPIGAIVHINGKPVGNSPIKGKNLSVRSYNIRVIKDGYEIWEQDVDIYAGAEKEVFAKLKLKEPESGLLWKDPYLGMEFVYVKGGLFEMGDVFGDGKSDEKPVHEVHVDGFWIGKYEVTQGQWEKVMGDYPPHFKKGENYPVECFHWDDTQKFIDKLNKTTGIKYRLPTEAEWEYAARSGGKKEKWAGTNSEPEIKNYAWYSLNSGNETHPVGQKKPNGLGLHDMSGNVWEWVQDWYDYNYYASSPTENPLGPQFCQVGEKRIVRGGCWHGLPHDARTSARKSLHPRTSITRSENVGFRLVLPAQPEQPFKREKEHPITSEGNTHHFLSQDYSGTPPTSQREPLYEPSSKPFQKEDLKDEAPPVGQSVKPQQAGLGVGAKIGLTVMVVLIGGIIFGLIRDTMGHGQYLWAAIVGSILMYIWIWSRPGRRK
jgi:formylglycine-generating enzyme required for sulfatase activity